MRQAAASIPSNHGFATQTSYIITLLPNYFENPGQLTMDGKRGDLLENFIVCEALKYRYNKGKGSNLSFFRDSYLNEVNLMLRYADRFDAIEVKSAKTYNPDFEKGLKALRFVIEPKTLFGVHSIIPILNKNIFFCVIMRKSKMCNKILYYNEKIIYTLCLVACTYSL